MDKGVNRCWMADLHCLVEASFVASRRPVEARTNPVTTYIQCFNVFSRSPHEGLHSLLLLTLLSAFDPPAQYCASSYCYVSLVSYPIAFRYAMFFSPDLLSKRDSGFGLLWYRFSFFNKYRPCRLTVRVQACSYSRT